MKPVEHKIRIDSTAQKIYDGDAVGNVFFLRSGVGTGKTTTSIVKAAMFCAQVSPPDADGNPGKARVLVVRQDQSKLRSTFLATFKEWFGHVSDDTTRMQYPLFIDDVPFSFKINGKNRTVLIQWVLLGVETQEEANTKLRSFEATCAIVDEVQTYPDSWIINNVFQRLGRYPMSIRDKNGDTIEDPNKTYKGQRMIICPFNPPTETHWLYKAEKMGEKPDNWIFFTYPPPLLPQVDPDNKWIGFEPNPEADYAQNQAAGYGYWLSDANSLIKQPGGLRKIKVDIFGEYGSSYSGRPVFEEWDDDAHIAKFEVKPLSGRKLIVGFDHSGVHPAMVVVQAGDGGYFAIDEIFAEDMIIEQFIDEVFVHWVNTNNVDRRDIHIILDPHDYRDRSGESTYKMLRKRNFQVAHARTNDPVKRQAAVKKSLILKHLRVNRKCSMLIEGMRGKYAREKIRGTDVYKSIPDAEKLHPISDVIDGLQYAIDYLYNGSGGVRDAATGKQLSNDGKRFKWGGLV